MIHNKEEYSQEYKNNVLYLEKLSERTHVNLVFLDLSEIYNINPLAEEFITRCLIKKKEKLIDVKKRKTSDNIKGEIFKKTQSENKLDPIKSDDNSSSSKKNKNENCLIF